MKVINFGSLNIDYVYSVNEFVKPGETISSNKFDKFCGGKGCNQSIALAKARLNVLYAGCVGQDGLFIEEKLSKNLVDISKIKKVDVNTGHAVIQVSSEGENAIIIYGGANLELDSDYIQNVLDDAKADDIILTQNETSCVLEILEMTSKKGLTTVFNPAPMTEAVKKYPLNLVNLLIINETEGKTLTGESTPENILNKLLENFPSLKIIITLGAKGAIFKSIDQLVNVKAPKVNALDTTAAGDTFIGYFLAEYLNNKSIRESLELACSAASLCVLKSGATDSIPKRDDI